MDRSFSQFIMEKKTVFGLIACFLAVFLVLHTADKTTEPFCNKEDGPCPYGTTKNPSGVSIFLPSRISTRSTSEKKKESEPTRILEYIAMACFLLGLICIIIRYKWRRSRCRGTRPEGTQTSQPEDIIQLQETIFNEDESIESLSTETEFLETSNSEESIEPPSIVLTPGSAEDVNQDQSST